LALRGAKRFCGSAICYVSGFRPTSPRDRGPILQLQLNESPVAEAQRLDAGFACAVGRVPKRSSDCDGLSIVTRRRLHASFIRFSGRSLGIGCVLLARSLGRSRGLRLEASTLFVSRSPPRWCRGNPWEPRLPPIAVAAEAAVRCKTRSRILTAPPVRFGSVRRNQLGRSLRRFASPAPSAHRVSHSHSGLLPTEPCGFVSRHIRP
jgi:hypothetical protein